MQSDCCPSNQFVVLVSSWLIPVGDHNEDCGNTLNNKQDVEGSNRPKDLEQWAATGTSCSLLGPRCPLRFGYEPMTYANSIESGRVTDLISDAARTCFTSIQPTNTFWEMVPVHHSQPNPRVQPQLPSHYFYDHYPPPNTLDR